MYSHMVAVCKAFSTAQPQGPDHDKHLLSLDQAFQHVDCFLMPKPCPKIESASLENPPCKLIS